jgi:predicted small secreted protein
MSRRIRLLALVALTSLVLGATACATVAGPSADDCTGTQGSGWCGG